MNLVHKRKQTTAKSCQQSLSKLPVGEVWVYGTGKLHADEYHQIPHLSAHVIKDLVNQNLSDYYLWRKYIKRNLEEKDSPAFLVGRAFHTAVLEPKLFDSEYTVQPKFDRRTKQGKEDAAAWDEANQGKQVLTDDQAESISAMAAAVRKNPYAKPILKGCQNEVTGFTRLPNGKILKGRIDAVEFVNLYGVDVKSADDVSPAGFARAAANFRYDLQAHTYKKLFGLDEFVFIVVSKADPIEVAVYTLNEEFMEKAAADFDKAVARWERLHSITTPQSFTNDDNPLITLAPPNWFKFD